MVSEKLVAVMLVIAIILSIVSIIITINVNKTMSDVDYAGAKINSNTGNVQLIVEGNAQGNVVGEEGNTGAGE